MLASLNIRDFALIENVTLEFGPGFNVVTGETGAGKSIIVDAIALLLGARATPDTIRHGAETAYIEGIFQFDGGQAAATVLERLGIEPADGETIITREQSKTRSVARIDGRAIPLRDLQALGPTLVDIHGQSEQLSLLRQARQLELLDEFAGLTASRQDVGALVAERRRVSREMESMTADERELTREADLLKFQVDEIQSAGLESIDEQELLGEHRRLANSRRLAELVRSIESAVTPSESGGSAADRVGSALDEISEMADLDESLAPRREQLQAVAELLDEFGGAMRSYGESLEDEPQRLAEIEYRIEAIATLKHKYGDTIQQVIEFGEAAEQRLNSITHSSELLEELEKRRSELEQSLLAKCKSLSERRQEGAATLTRIMAAGLREVGMKDSRFGIELSVRPDEDGVLVPGRDEPVRIDETGMDSVSFVISPNRGQPLRPVSSIASGGETSRIMLALKAALGEADKTPTLIFDEVEQGVGSRNARVIGEKLGSLARKHQVLCVTHLPQVAAFADTHFFVEKLSTNGQTIIGVRRLAKADALGEIAQMTGSGKTASKAAEEMLRQARKWKAGQTQD